MGGGLFCVGFFSAAAGGGCELAGFVDDAREFFNDAVFGETLSFGYVNEGDVGTAEEFFHVVGVAAGVFDVVLDAFFELDGADRAQAAFVAENEIDGFVVNETVSGVAVLGADFVAEEGRKADLGYDVKLLAEEIVEHLEALTFGADHEMFARAVFETIHSFFLAATGSNSDEYGHEKEQHCGDDGYSDVNFVSTE